MTKRRSKRYHPKPIRVDAMNWAIAGSCVMPAGHQKDLMSHVDAALDKLRHGIADRDDWNTLANALNISEELANFEIGPNLMPAVKAGQDALHDVALRMMANGSSTCRGSELTAITEAIDMYRIQLRFCTQAEFSKSVERVQTLLQSGAIKRVSDTYRMLAEKEAA